MIKKVRERKQIMIKRFTLEGKYVDTIGFSEKFCNDNLYAYSFVRNASRPTWYTGLAKQVYSAYGYLWIEEEHYSEEELDRKIKNKLKDGNYNAKAHRLSIPVQMINVKTGEVEKTYLSIRQASFDTGHSTTAIRNNLHGITVEDNGYVWRYDKR